MYTYKACKVTTGVKSHDTRTPLNMMRVDDNGACK